MFYFLLFLLIAVVSTTKNGYKENHSSQSFQQRQQPRIRNGTLAELGHFPFFAALQNNRYYVFCGGSIITDIYILTAAHCFFKSKTKEKLKSEDMNVMVGTIYRYGIDDQKYPVNNTISHPNYVPGHLCDDIGIVELLKPIKFNPNVQPISLSKYLVEDATLIAIGFGNLGNDFYPFNLQYTNLSSIETAECCPLSGDSICIYTPQTMICDGDSGGPIVYMNEIQQYVQIGVITNMDMICPIARRLYFRDVSYHASWIKSVALKV